MDTASVTVQLVPADLRRFSGYVEKRLDGGWRGWVLLGVAIVMLGSAFVLPGRHHARPAPREPFAFEQLQKPSLSSKLAGYIPYGIFGLVVLFYGYFHWKGRQSSAYEPYAPGIFDPATYEVLDRGLLCRNDHGERINYWKVVTQFIETEQDFYIMFAARNGHTVPKRFFPTQEAAAIFRNQLQLHLETHAPAALAGHRPIHSPV